MTSLAGRRIVVTREESEAGPLCTAVRDAGATPLLSPTIEVAPLHSASARKRLVPPLADFDWLVVTSPRAVRLLAEIGTFSEPRPDSLRIAAAGERTADALGEEGWSADRVPEAAGAEPLLRVLLRAREGGPEARRKVLFPASVQAGDILPRGLESAGFEVRRIDLYAPRPRPQDRSWWAERIREGVDAVTFTSPSAVDGLTRGVGEGTLLAALRDLPAGVQGPTTAAAAREAGWVDVIEARPRSFQGLVGALAARLPLLAGPTSTSDRLPA